MQRQRRTDTTAEGLDDAFAIRLIRGGSCWVPSSGYVLSGIHPKHP